MGAAQDCGVQHARKMHVGDVLRGAGDFGDRVGARHVAADDEEAGALRRGGIARVHFEGLAASLSSRDHLFVCATGAGATASGCGPAANQVTRRAAFVLMACLAAHDKTAKDGEFLKFLPGVSVEYSDIMPLAVAVRGFEFSPAEIDDKPAAIRVVYRYLFTVREEKVVPTTGVLTGTIKDADTKQPLAQNSALSPPDSDMAGESRR